MIPRVLDGRYRLFDEMPEPEPITRGELLLGAFLLAASAVVLFGGLTLAIRAVFR